MILVLDLLVHHRQPKFGGQQRRESLGIRLHQAPPIAGIPHWGIPGKNGGGGFTPFSLDLGSPVVGEFIFFFHGFAIQCGG